MAFFGHSLVRLGWTASQHSDLSSFSPFGEPFKAACCVPSPSGRFLVPSPFICCMFHKHIWSTRSHSLSPGHLSSILLIIQFAKSLATFCTPFNKLSSLASPVACTRRLGTQCYSPLLSKLNSIVAVRVWDATTAFFCFSILDKGKTATLRALLPDNGFTKRKNLPLLEC